MDRDKEVMLNFFISKKRRRMEVALLYFDWNHWA